MKRPAGARGCSVNSLLALIPWPWRIAGIAALLLVVGMAAGAGVWRGYQKGYAAAKIKGEAALAEEKRDRAEENAARALAVARAEEKARRDLESAVKASAAIEANLLNVTATLAAERNTVNKRIADAAKAAAATCSGLPADWVRAYNDALLGPDSSAGSQKADSAGAQGPARSSAGTVPRLPQGQSLTSPADILAHARDYGNWCRRNTAQLNGWINLSEGWE